VAHIALVAIPYFLTARHRLIAEQMMASITSTHEVDRIAVVNQARADDEGWLHSAFSCVLYNEQNNLARAWNRGIQEALARGAEAVVVSNMDVLFHPYCIDNLYECIQQEADAIVWSAVPWRNPETFPHAELLPMCKPGVSWSCFAVNARLLTEVGEFDEGFTPAYREDSDMEYRIKLRGLRTVSCCAALYLDTGRGTIKGLYECGPTEIASSARLLRDLRLHITRNDERYMQKWGGLGKEEKFKKPFTPEA